MNKLIKLIYVNLLSLFNINQIFVARETGAKSNLETKSIITSIILLFYGFILYQIFTKLNLANNFLIINIGFFLTTLLCFIINLTSIEPLLFRNPDNEMLFAMPVTKEQILFSKIFSIYLKNMIIVAIIMITTILAYTNKVGDISDTFGLIYFMNCFVIPFIPIVTASLITYFDDYCQTNFNKKIYRFIKYFIIAIIIVILAIAIFNLPFQNAEDLISKITNTYLFTYLFSYSLANENIIAFIASIGVPILILFLYYEIISNNYTRICSLLKGIKKKISFIYPKTTNMGPTLGIVKKEITYLFQNKLYLATTYGPILGLSIALFFVLRYTDFTKYQDIPFFYLYFNTYLPPILATLATFKCPSISSFSLEKDNAKMLRTMPVSFGHIIFAKWLANIIIGSFFVIINGTMTLLMLKLELAEKILCFALPFATLVFISFTSLILDLRFKETSKVSDNEIIKSRLINLIPSCISIFIGLLPILFPLTDRYYFTLGSYIIAMFFALIIEIIYYNIKKDDLIHNLLK